MWSLSCKVTAFGCDDGRPVPGRADPLRAEDDAEEHREQQETFGGSVYVDPKDLDEINQELEHVDNGVNLAGPDHDLDPVVTWWLLPMHPKVAILEAVTCALESDHLVLARNGIPVGCEASARDGGTGAAG